MTKMNFTLEPQAVDGATKWWRRRGRRRKGRFILSKRGLFKSECCLFKAVASFEFHGFCVCYLVVVAAALEPLLFAYYILYTSTCTPRCSGKLKLLEKLTR